MWAELPIDLLGSIFKRVGVIEYLMCACVCKSWRSVAIDFKHKFMASQDPLVFIMPKHDNNHGYFYNMFERRLYRAALPHLAENRCWGVTCGYLVLSGLTEDTTNIWLVNPFTRHELEFPTPPYPFCHCIMASLANSDGEFVVIAFSKIFPYLQFRRSGDVTWYVCRYGGSPCRLIDVAVFKGKIYVLSSYGEIWTLSLNSDTKLTRLEVTSVAACQYNLHLVASHEELYIAHFHPAEDFIQIHKLNFERRQWEEVKLQGAAFFLGEMKCCGFSFPTPSWSHICEHMNPVWYLRYYPEDEIIGHHTALFVADRLKWQLPAVPEYWMQPKILCHSPNWYFPHLSSTVDSVNED